MASRCVFTGKDRNVANHVSHSHRKSKRVQKANVARKRIYVPSKKKWVNLKVSTAALRSIEKMGIDAFIKKTGVQI
ncbi:MAG: 50S ribosomal protein L28 [Candidatus Sumerlaeota bacterium]